VVHTCRLCLHHQNVTLYGKLAPQANRAELTDMRDPRPGWRTRFAPSPTGALHAGSVRTALFNYLAARATGGSFLLRVEDTDQGRYHPGSELQILDSLRWLGLDWDEGPEIGGPHEPYIQSQRTHLYRSEADRLIAAGAAYWCTCTPARLEQMRAEQRRAGRPTRYDRRCLERQEEVAAEMAAGAPAVLRQLIPHGRTEWKDLIRGPIAFDNVEIDDQVLLKSDGFPTYHLANVVDDHAMEVSHVIRAEEWIPSTPKHLCLYTALGWEPPRFAHVPVVLGEDGHKLSKRRGARDILEYRALGYLPSALVNAMALLGWSSGTEEEVFTLEELIERFSLERVNPAPAVLDRRRLDALNGLHIRRLPPARLAEELEPWLPGTTGEQRLALVPLLQKRMSRLDEAQGLAGPLLDGLPHAGEVEFPPRKVDAATAAALLDATVDLVEEGGLEEPDDELVRRLGPVVEERGVRRGDGLRVLYVAILGSAAGVPVFDAMRFIGAEASVARLRAARERLDI
jgi:glutamyl-tRNA synthetase